jgi:AcrR family transcriptional regulator
MPPPRRRSASETREHVLDVAGELFYWHGVHATGVDTVTARAEVAPTTLYRLFGSKDGLVTAYVERASQRYRQRWAETADHAGPDPRAQVRALFDALVDEVDPADCRGCLFLLAVAEIPEPEHPAHVAVRAVKQWVRATFVALGQRIAPTPASGEELGEELALLVEGVYGAVQTRRDQEPARLARRLAHRACEHATERP